VPKAGGILLPIKGQRRRGKGGREGHRGVSEGRVSFLLPTLLVFYAAGAKKGWVSGEKGVKKAQGSGEEGVKQARGSGEEGVIKGQTPFPVPTSLPIYNGAARKVAAQDNQNEKYKKIDTWQEARAQNKKKIVHL